MGFVGNAAFQLILLQVFRATADLHGRRPAGPLAVRPGAPAPPVACICPIGLLAGRFLRRRL